VLMDLYFLTVILTFSIKKSIIINVVLFLKEGNNCKEDNRC